MEKIVAHNDGRMRCVCSKRIYEEAFGLDGIDPCKSVLDRSKLVEEGNIQGNLCSG